MTLTQAIKTIELVASHQPSINMIVENDVFRINQSPELRYGVFAWVQGQHSGTADGNTHRLQFTFFYVDRLTADKGNEVEIQSVGMQTIENIARQLNDLGMYIDSYTFQPFNQRFTDECAGVFSTMAIDVPVGSLCGEDFADFNNDFNEDFLIY